MANTILLKRNSTAAAQPTAGQLSAGELAINTADGKLFAKNAANAIINLPVTSISGQAIAPSSVGATGNVSGSTLTSTVATGTAPLSVTSTTAVTNLNADTVDGQHASAFAAAQSFTATNANTVTLTAARDAFYRYTVISPVTVTLPTANQQTGDIVCILIGTYATGSLTVAGAATGTDVLSAAGQKVTYQFVSGQSGGWFKLPVDSLSGQTITPNTVGVNVASPTSKLHVKHSETANGTDSVAKLLSASTTTTSDTEWKGRTLLGAQNLTFLVGCFNSMAAIGAHSWTSADSQTGAAWADMYFNPDGAAKIYLGAVPNAGWTPDQGILCVDNSSGKVGMGTNSPQANFQMVIGYDESFDNADPPNAVYTAATSTLEGAAQTEILQVIHGGHEYDTNSESYVLNEYINLARFHVNNAGCRGSFSLSNSGNGAWENNVLQFFVHGSSYGPGYYGGNACDAGCAMIVTQGSDIQKLQIGNLTAAPIEFFTGNVRRLRIRDDENPNNITNYNVANYDVYASMPEPDINGPGIIFHNTADSVGEMAAIAGGTDADDYVHGCLRFFTGAANTISEQVRINWQGNVGVGTTTPTVKLDVAGDIKLSGALQSPGEMLYLWSNFR